MSVLFDSHWWWRAQFGGQFNPYLESENDQPVSSFTVAIMPSGSTAGYQRNHDSSTVDNINSATFVDMLVDPSEIPDLNWEELGDLELDW